MDTAKIAEQLCDCIIEGIHAPHNQRPYTDEEKLEILENLICYLQMEEANIRFGI